MLATHIERLGLDERGHGLWSISVIGVVRWAVSRGHRALCGLRGHEMVRHFEPARLSLRCVACGAETPGWTIDVRPAFRRVAPPRAKVHRLAAGTTPPPRSSCAPSDRCLALVWRNIAEESARTAKNSPFIEADSSSNSRLAQRGEDVSAGPICAPGSAIGVTPLGENGLTASGV